MFSDLFAWLDCAFTVIWKSIVDFLHDITVRLFETFLDAVMFLLSFLDPTLFISAVGLGDLLGSIDPGILYFISFFNLPACFSILSGAIGFRMVRKFITLFQW